MTPGAYLRRRREAAGLSIEEVATLMASPSGVSSHAFDAATVGMIERDQLVPPIELLARVASAVRLDRYTFILLGFGRAAEICRDCGCSALDACIDEHSGEHCAWADRGPAADGTRLCTTCHAKDQAHAA